MYICIYIYIYQIYKKSAIKVSFSFFFSTMPQQPNLMETLQPKKKLQYLFERENFVDKTTFNFHLFNIFNDFFTTQYTTAIFCSFYLNPQS